MSADIPTATQFTLEAKRHIFDFAPALLDGEVLDTDVVCNAVTESGSGTMRCIDIYKIGDAQVYLLLVTSTPGRYLVEVLADTITDNVDELPVNAEGQALVSRLRITVI